MVYSGRRSHHLEVNSLIAKERVRFIHACHALQTLHMRWAVFPHLNKTFVDHVHIHRVPRLGHARPL